MSTRPVLDPERRAALLGAKLRALVDAGFDDTTALVPGGFPGGATLGERSTGRAWVLGQDEPAKLLGRALAWAEANGVVELHLIVEDAAGLLARRASQFDHPPTVWWAADRELHRVQPDPLPEPLLPDPRALALSPVLEAAGATVVVDHGVVAGEILGLEIARVIVDDDGPRIEVGVGRHDREAFAMVHGDLPTDAALTEVISTVRHHRTAGFDAHPLRRLAAERWLREVVIHHPELVAARRLERRPGTVIRTNLKEPVPAAASGIDDEGRPVVVACSVGVDLDLVPTAADVRLAHDRRARLVLAVPERDAVPVTRRLAATLVDPAEVVTVEGDWRGREVP